MSTLIDLHLKPVQAYNSFGVKSNYDIVNLNKHIRNQTKHIQVWLLLTQLQLCKFSILDEVKLGQNDGVVVIVVTHCDLRMHFN